jgi:tRNA(fMet)-specific endonuclease VapC
MPYLLDSDWIINALAGRRGAVEVLGNLAVEGIAVSLISVGEVYEGAFGSPNPAAHLDAFRRFLRPHRVLGLNDPIMERFAQVRYMLRRRGEMIPDLDLLLGATALHYNLTLLTFNVRHMARIPGLRLHSPR